LTEFSIFETVFSSPPSRAADPGYPGQGLCRAALGGFVMIVAMMMQGSKAEYRALNEQLVAAELLMEAFPLIQQLLVNIREHSESMLLLEIVRAESQVSS
jgi:hypothetical protein